MGGKLLCSPGARGRDKRCNPLFHSDLSLDTSVTHASYQTTQRAAPALTIGASSLQAKTAANSGMLASGAFTRKRLMACGSPRLRWLANSGRSALHQLCA